VDFHDGLLKEKPLRHATEAAATQYARIYYRRHSLSLDGGQVHAPADFYKENPGWTSQYNKKAQAAKRRKMAGHRPGSIKVLCIRKHGRRGGISF
jgi:hypothetical protein